MEWFLALLQLPGKHAYLARRRWNILKKHPEFADVTRQYDYFVFQYEAMQQYLAKTDIETCVKTKQGKQQCVLEVERIVRKEE